MTSVHRCHTLVTTCVLITIAPPASARQQTDYRTLRWWHPVVAAAGVSALLLVDEPLRDFIQDHRSNTLDDIARVTNKFKDPPVFLVSGGAAIVGGLATGHPVVTRTGLQIWAAYGLSSAMMIGTKFVFGRTRPSATPDDPFDFDWMNGGEDASFPSGSSTVSFSLATILADAIHHPAATVILYTAAASNAWARLNGDRHWLTDVTAGALYGITAAKLVNGHWRVFGLRPPSFLIGPDGQAAIRTGFSW